MLIQVLSLCPHYYVLGEKFTSRAGIRASSTSDRLFEGIASDEEDLLDEDYCYNRVLETVLESNNDQDDEDNLSADSKDRHNAQKQTS